MRTIINYFRQVFCKHDWLAEEGKVGVGKYGNRGHRTVVYMRCKKCGYFIRHGKFQ